MDDGTRSGAIVPGAALVALLLFDVLRVWLPSLLFVVADAGETSALVMGAIALGVTVAAPVIVLLSPPRAARTVWLAAVAVLLVARLVLQVSDGGPLQFGSSALALVAAAVALGALGIGTPAAGLTRVSVVLGVTASGVIHAGLGTTDLVWRDGPSAWLATLALVGATAYGAWRAAAVLDGTGDGHGRAWPWWLLGPVLLLLSVLVLVPGRIAAATRWSDPLVAATLVGCAGALLVAMLLGRWAGPPLAGPIGAGLVLVGTTGSLQASSLVSVASQLTLAAGLGAVVAALEPTGADVAARRVGVAAAGVPLGLTVIGFAYYAGYDLLLTFPNRLVLLLTGGIIAAAALLAGANRNQPTLRERATGRRMLRAVAATAGVAAVAAVLVAGSDRAPPQLGVVGDEIRVAVANIHMGFDPQGRLSVHELGAELAALGPDIVVLNEIDRGWLTTGGRDTLRQLSAHLGLRYVFGPAADEVWGNAVLSRYPIRDLSVERLPRGRDAMTRSQLITLIEVAPEQQIAVIATHLSHVDLQGDTRIPQARALAAAVARLQDRGLPVVLAGDLNAQPEDPELTIFEDVLRSTLPPGNPTWPSWDPQVQIDHLLVSEEFRFRDSEVLDTQVSDHRPLVSTLELSPPS